MGFRRYGLAAALSLGMLLAACGGGEREAPRVAAPPADDVPGFRPPPAARQEPEAEAAAAPAPAAAPACAEGAYERMRTQRVAHAAFVRSAADAFREPGRDRLARFGRLNENGAPTAFGVLGRIVDRECEARWYRVQLPMKPNGIVGYVSAADVDVRAVRTRILVELSARRVTLLRDGREVIRATAAIGSAVTPTPIGNFYVNQRLRPRDPTGPFGPGAIGISAFSEVLTGWVQGGPVALHGTNRPDLVGQAVSNGCLRLHNDVLERMFELAVVGTPVVVRT